MTIADPAYAAQVVTTTGRAFKLDSSECLRGFLDSGSLAAPDVHSSWVTAIDTESLVKAESAWYVQSVSIRSPMGGGLAAFSTRSAAESAAAVDGRVMDWDTFRAGGAAMKVPGHGH